MSNSGLSKPDSEVSELVFQQLRGGGLFKAQSLPDGWIEHHKRDVPGVEADEGQTLPPVDAARGGPDKDADERQDRDGVANAVTGQGVPVQR